ncbi:GNAT family N-acetyltransferase [Thalassobacillus pellis]|uniref:GNAT family N-acetyltransferase n=1 Tax=Thalassobacillus pellis TaxID=748008 RepID=UPI0019603B2F|nr:GNAT family N-acetyltransferase [Thalassobacillus pellis]MBM7551142.1 ribosomal protein S18 acetylase RimI-like enzyme [Thalassobacillus pellis]
MLIKRLTPDDAANYWELRLEALQNAPDAFITTYGEAKARENPIEHAAGRMSNKGNYTYGAYLANEMIGSVTMLRQEHPKYAHKADILAMYVSPRGRGHGAGKKMLQKAMEDAARDGIEKLMLAVVSTNTPAVKLYESVGFKKFGVEENAVKNAEGYLDEDLMVYFL